MCLTDTTGNTSWHTEHALGRAGFILLCAILTRQTNCGTEAMGQAATPARAPQRTVRPSPHSLLGIGIVAGVFAVNAYRATHQSITADEAYTWDFYVDKPFNWFLVIYTTNNHVLHTLLCRLSVQALGLSELTMRLPSLAGGLLYLVFSHKLCRLLFKNLWLFLLALAALTLNPFITDYLSVARGYGMALGFFIAALYFVIRFFDDESNAAKFYPATGAAVLLGLSISANIAFVFPAIVLAGILTLLRLVDAQTGTWGRRVLWSLVRVWLPLLCPAVLFMAIPLAHARSSDFYKYGQDSLHETALSLVQRSLFPSVQPLDWRTTPGCRDPILRNRRRVGYAGDARDSVCSADSHRFPLVKSPELPPIERARPSVFSNRGCSRDVSLGFGCCPPNIGNALSHRPDSDLPGRATYAGLGSNDRESCRMARLDTRAGQCPDSPGIAFLPGWIHHFRLL